MSLNHLYRNSPLSQEFDLECKSIIIAGNSFIPPALPAGTVYTHTTGSHKVLAIV